MHDPSDTALPPDVAAWIGRRAERSDVLSRRLADSLRATLAPHLADGPGAPLGAFWCLAPDIAGSADLGADGHPRTGLFLPALPFPRRMWAGGELTLHGPFAAGDVVTKTSVIEDVAVKRGSTGRLAFVTLRHGYRVDGRPVLDERQDVVYRDPAGAGPTAQGGPAPDGFGPVVGNWTVAVDPTLLFRYSALTFNGHRIHYDHPYATTVEGYDGLVVHGPLQATLMLNLAAAVLGTVPRRFGYRGRTPLICDGAPLRVEAARGPDGGLSLRILSAGGAATMVADAA